MSKDKLTKNPLLILLLAAILIAALFILIKSTNKTTETIKIGESEAKVEEANIALDNGLIITKIGSYTGTYMEDASDEQVSDVMMILVSNTTETALQYAEITLSTADNNSVANAESATTDNNSVANAESATADNNSVANTNSATGNNNSVANTDSNTALFKLSTLNPGETVMVLESNRKSYDEDVEYTTATAQNVVFFTEELTTYEDKLQIQPLDGGFNITNISEEDITGEIMVYFKDYVDNMLYGGITYRGRIEGGLKSGEIRQIMTDNFSESNTKVMFITITETE